MYTHCFSFNPDICLHIHSAECTVRFLNQAGRNNYPYNPKFVGNTGNRTRDLWLDKCISNQQLYHLSYSATKIPLFSRTAPQAATRLYDEFFAVYAGKLWNILPKEVTVVKQLEQLKILLNKFLHKYPDQPPTKGYTASNRNSLIDWNLQSGGPQLARSPC